MTNKLNAEFLAAQGWVGGHWRIIAIASLALNATLLLLLLV